MQSRPVALALILACLCLAQRAAAEADRDRFGAAGYFRFGTRPDFQGGNSKLGFWNISGRLLNEDPYAALELKFDLLQPEPDGDRPWTSLHTKGELASDAEHGPLSKPRLPQLYVQAGNLLVK